MFCNSCGVSIPENSKFCPGCGGQLTTASAQPQLDAPTKSTACPRCNSQQTSSVEMVVQMGTQHGSGVGVGMTGSGQFGVGFTGSVNMNSLAKKYYLGPKPGVFSFASISIISAIIASFPGLIFAVLFGGGISTFVITVIIFGVLIFLLFIGYKTGQDKLFKKWDEQRIALDGLWLCLQCGNEWKPLSKADESN